MGERISPEAKDDQASLRDTGRFRTLCFDGTRQIDPDQARARHGLDRLEREAGAETDDTSGFIHTVTKGDT